MKFFGVKILAICSGHENGAALPFALIMATIMMICCSMIMKGNIINARHLQRLIDKQQAFYLAESGLEKALWNLANSQTPLTMLLPLKKEVDLDFDCTADIHVDAFGGYLRIRSLVVYKGIEKGLSALVGEHCEDVFKEAIALGGSQYPLVLNGNTSITGDVKVGLKGVEKGRIKGIGFKGEKLVEGKIKKTSMLKMPEWQQDLVEHCIEQYKSLIEMPEADVVLEGDQRLDAEILALYADQSLHIDGDLDIFAEDCVTVYAAPNRISCSGDLKISSCHFKHMQIECMAGGIIDVDDVVSDQMLIFYSDSSIVLSGSCRLPCQLFTDRDITLKDRCELLYPSFVFSGCIEHNEKQEGRIVLEDSAVVRGIVMLRPLKDDEKKPRRDIMLDMDEHVRIIGILYNSGYTTMAGEVVGSVASGAFGLHVAPTYYINWLKDVKVDRPALPRSFLLPIGFSKGRQLRVISYEEMEKVKRMKLEG
ncbi:pilus assembly PilX N-terminal domain-containing protein [bacterium]|nr:pilus assembly PilX N-terminal domain-containing protein [bacterium]